MRPLVSTRARGMLFNQTARLAPYHPLHGVAPSAASQVLHGRRQLVVVSRPVESTQRAQSYHRSVQEWGNHVIPDPSTVVALLQRVRV